MFGLRHTSSRISPFGIALAGVALALAWAVPAAEEAKTAGISVGRMLFCRSIKDREPQEAAETFPNTLEKVYCFTVILDAGPETHVVHRWYHGDKLMAEIELKAKGDYWRTWSSKGITPGWTGTWRVDVVSADGEVLKSGSFELVAEGAESGQADESGGPQE
jgi:hypothetical protein